MADETKKGMITRRTGKGNWIVRLQDGREVQLPGSDKDLAVGVEIEVEGVTRGDHVYFADRYRVKGTEAFIGRPRRTGPSELGIIVSGTGFQSEAYGSFDYWGAMTPIGGVPEGRQGTHGRKRRDHGENIQSFA